MAWLFKDVVTREESVTQEKMFPRNKEEQIITDDVMTIVRSYSINTPCNKYFNTVYISQYVQYGASAQISIKL